MRTRVAFLLLFSLLFAAGAQAQDEVEDLNPRFGLSLNGLLSTEDGFGLGIRGRASSPVNADFSAAVDLGVTGFILGGREDATYIFDPQVSGIINLPASENRLPYILAGIGAHLPISNVDASVSGPTLHGGIGWVHALTDTSLFYEVNPALVIGENSIDLLVPFRIGLIFR